ncbi:MAG: TolC family protein [Caulobacteraceae bacterium]|nr:TolC family protein [Caulobacteraceae bacterium]
MDTNPGGAAQRAARVVALLGLSVAILTGCAAYRPLPLPAGPDAAAGPDRLKMDLAQLRVQPLGAIRIDARKITPLAAGVLAALNNPDLRAKRAALGVPAAEVFAAGLLPDPQINGGVDQPIAGPDTHTAFSLSPSLDIAGLLAAASSERAARFTASQADLEVLWAEWTTAQQARRLAETVLADEARAVRLRPTLAAASARAASSTEALGRHDVAASAAMADEAARLDAADQLAAAEQAARQARRDLNALLGLDAAAILPLVPDPAGANAYSDAEIAEALASLPRRRPDLLALQAGYAAEDAKLRQAILAQFPLASAAFAYARDPTPTTTVGVSAALVLPIFNGGRGQVKVQAATREQLRAEYQARLDQAEAEVKDAAAQRAEAEAQANAVRASAPRLQAMAAPAPEALQRRDIDSGTYLALTQAAAGAETHLEDRELAARLAQIALETALFIPPVQARTAS